MYSAYWCSAKLLALMECAHTEPNKAFSHDGLHFYSGCRHAVQRFCVIE
jgi:hypothetical protein